MLIYLSLLVSLIGLLVYILAARAEVKELGRLAFACGLLAFLLRFSPDGMVGVLAGR